MELTPEHYFEWSYRFFLEREEQVSDTQERYLRIANGLIIRLRFAGRHMVAPLIRALAHLVTDAVDDPDLTICIWDNPTSGDKVLLYPFDYDPDRTGRHRCGSLHLGFENWPPRLSLYSPEKKLALFWISDIERLPWWERCRPLRDIIHWWARQYGWYMVHAACIGTATSGIVLTGHRGAGKSTTALSSLNSGLCFIADDLCLLGFENQKPVAYSLHASGKLEGFDKLPALEQHVYNRRRAEGEKAFLYVNECFPEQMLTRVPVVAIVVPTVAQGTRSELVRISSNEAFQVLAGSTGIELKSSGADNFFGAYKLCKALPCYRLQSGSDLEELNRVIKELIDESSTAAADRSVPDLSPTV
jgi:hypothetical protein